MTIDVGNGDPTIVLIHGLCCAPSDYQNLIDRFSQNHRVLAPTLRGHSKDGSIAEQMSIEQLAADVAQFLIDKNIRNAVLCGHSLGTRVAIEAQAMLPSHISALVLIDGSNVATANQESLLDSYNAATAGDKFEPWLQQLFSQMFLPGKFEQEQRMYKERISTLSNEHIATLYRNMIIWDSEKFDNQLSAAAAKPVLVLQSTMRDTATTRRSLLPEETGDYPERIRSVHPNSTIVAYPHMSHFIHLDAPDKIVSDINQWMSDCELR